MPRKLEKQLQSALDDAAREGLAIHEAKLIQARITALLKLIEFDQTIGRLTAELDRVTEENRLLTERLPTSPKPIESLERIKRTLESAEAIRRQNV